MIKNFLIPLFVFIISMLVIYLGLLFLLSPPIGTILCEFPEIEISSIPEEIFDKKPEFQPLYDQKIPFTIIQTNAKRKVSFKLKYCVDRLTRFNPEYEYVYYDDEACRNFLREYYPPNVLECYNLLIPGAFKGDLFRACYLYEKGGIYLDSGMSCIIPLREVIRSTDEFISVRDFYYPLNDFKNPFIYNAFIACIPKHPIIKNYLDKIIKNIENRSYSDNVLGITGPLALGRSFVECLNINKSIYEGDYGNGIRLLQLLIPINQSLKEPINIVKEGDRSIFTTKYNGYKQDHYSNKPYLMYYLSKQVYGEKGKLSVNKVDKICRKIDKTTEKVSLLPSIRVSKFTLSGNKINNNERRLKIKTNIPRNPREKLNYHYLLQSNPDCDFIDVNILNSDIDFDIELDLSHAFLEPLRYFQCQEIIKNNQRVYFNANFSEKSCQFDDMVVRLSL